ncbi:MAG: hypothetical protein ABF932_07670 [Gluconobacter potus]|uniref:Uncharacterized protein n=1 Tax=Gluconobacter potus TaxID=2724927 RepID=A0ABR9YJL3_9PROT|nr:MULTISPECIES: hypothetical protein [Gluconobacter]MBF0864305.1 hypothetical protein [Gluconobacter sp. R71656]MBF0867813.1 hypothetical protein [Gluconobacter sp. R75628]MBF0872738.1 hypothetical protein [Gluconobacter sp. R75629]MBF0881984.1 hypothetical protein [Gluconobacter potus]
MSTTALPDWFQKPENRFRTAAFWFWHHLPTPQMCREAIADMKRAGLGCILVQARLAMPLSDYLSPNYLALCRLVSDLAEEHGLSIEIYDEYGWMSGHGGGLTVQGADHLRERHLFWTTGILQNGQTILQISGIDATFLDFLGPAGRRWTHEGGKARWGLWQIVAGGVIPSRTLLQPSQIRFLETSDSGCTVQIIAPDLPDETPVALFVAATCLTSRLVNYLLPETAERFSNRVYAPLRAAFPKAEAFFFDHPYAGFYTWNGQNSGSGPDAIHNSLLWDDSLIDAGINGIVLLDAVYGTDPQAASRRAYLFETYARQMHHAFFGTLRRWCDTHDIGLTGHELLPHVGGWNLLGGLDGIDARVSPGVDYFDIDTFKTQTVTDAADYSTQLSAILGDSLARAHGRTRCTVEQYSTGREVGRPSLHGQWDLSLSRLRAQMIRHILQGARRVLLHALFLPDAIHPNPSHQSDPRFDFAPGFNLQPWWEDAPDVLEEVARLSAFLEDGTPIRSVALLYPLEELRESSSTPDCAAHFGFWAEALMDAGVGYTVIDEKQISEETVCNGWLHLVSGQFDTLILPDVTVVRDPQTLSILEKFSHTGGRLLRSGKAITTSRNDRTRWIEGPVITTSEITRLIKENFPPPLLSIEGQPQRITLQRLTPSLLRIAIFNDSDQERTARLAPAPRERILLEWRCNTGVAMSPVCVPANTTFTLSLMPRQLSTFELSVTTAEIHCFPMEDKACLPTSYKKMLKDGWLFQPDPESRPVPIAVECGWEQQGFEYFSGTGIYTLHLSNFNRPYKETLHLVLPKIAGTVKCFINGLQIGKSIEHSASFLLPSSDQDLKITLHIRNTAANTLYPTMDSSLSPTTFLSGLLAPPYIWDGIAQIKQMVRCRAPPL